MQGDAGYRCPVLLPVRGGVGAVRGKYVAHDSVDVGYNLPGKQFAINTLNTGGIGGWPRALGQNLNGAQCKDTRGGREGCSP